MALNGEGEPRPTLMQVATQAATIELFRQWQTYANGVHMDYDTFRSINFRAIAEAVIAAAGFPVETLDATLQLPKLDDEDITEMPKLRALLTRESPFAPPSPPVNPLDKHVKVAYPKPGSAAWNEHMRQVQG